MLLVVLQDTLLRLLDGKPSCYNTEIEQLNQAHDKHFSKWMLQLQLSSCVCVCVCVEVV